MKRIFVLFFLILLFFTAKSQNSDRWSFGSDLKRTFNLGGELGLTIGSNTSIMVSARGSYNFNNFIALGINPFYWFVQSNYYYPATSIHMTGMRVFLDFSIIKMLYLHCEFEELLYKAPALDYPYNKIWYTSKNLLVGPGTRQPITNSLYAYIEVLWNLNENMNSIYYSPIIRAGAIYVFPQTLKKQKSDLEE
ncbi:MAG TPA: hypothetical protein PLA78_05470 [Bacteroidales bacterium]|nr:hypothetical protein [Bacteroidales bacterium]HQM78596.1 hypothetical protein [Bacteroidales bacterium]